MDVGVVLALASAVAWGAGDFFGGFASRESEALGTTWISQALGFVGLLVVSLLIGGVAHGADIGWGVAAGLSSMIGLALFFHAMGMARLGPVASIASVVTAVVPVVAGLIKGERPALLTMVGIGLGILAVWLIAGGEHGESDVESPGSDSVALGLPMTARILAIASGLFFGAFFVFLEPTSHAAGLWPIVAGRGAATIVLGTVLMVLGRSHPERVWRPVGMSLRFAMLSGVLDSTANALYLLASRSGMLSVVAVLASMYPVSTVLLASTVLGERLGTRQKVGMAAGLVAVALIAA